MFGSKKRIYLDYAGATALCAESQAAMREAEALSGNPGALHAEGVAALNSLKRSRERIAHELACKPRELLFTSGLTEANNSAILGHAQYLDRSGRDLTKTHWIVSAIEHPSVLECFNELERLGAMVSRIAPKHSGVVSKEELASALTKETLFVSIGWANSEIGTVQPLSDIAHIIRRHEKAHGTQVLLHADAGQAPLYQSPQVHTLGVDIFSLGSGKLYGPRGIGALYLSSRATLAPLLIGGGQEKGGRAGTESVALAAGFAAAMTLIGEEREKEQERVRKLRDRMARVITSGVPGAVINGSLERALPHILNISIPGLNSEYLVLALDRAGVALSTKAACSEGSERESHVVAALGEEAWRAKSTLRISLGRGVGEKDLSDAAARIVRVVEDVRKIGA